MSKQCTYMFIHHNVCTCTSMYIHVHKYSELFVHLYIILKTMISQWNLWYHSLPFRYITWYRARGLYHNSDITVVISSQCISQSDSILWYHTQNCDITLAWPKVPDSESSYRASDYDRLIPVHTVFKLYRHIPGVQDSRCCHWCNLKNSTQSYREMRSAMPRTGPRRRPALKT